VLLLLFFLFSQQVVFDNYFDVRMIWTSTKLIISFLSIRKFSVSVEGEISTPRIMQARVTQGSILFLTLFNMYINDTPQAICVMPDCWLEVGCIRKVLRPANSIKVFCGFPWSQSKC
jgi:hypothetical protein